MVSLNLILTAAHVRTLVIFVWNFKTYLFLFFEITSSRNGFLFSLLHEKTTVKLAIQFFPTYILFSKGLRLNILTSVGLHEQTRKLFTILCLHLMHNIS